jgi:hypothetical protein
MLGDGREAEDVAPYKNNVTKIPKKCKPDGITEDKSRRIFLRNAKAEKGFFCQMMSVLICTSLDS